MNHKGQTIILVTHDVKVASRGQRVVYIADGRITDELRLADDQLHLMNGREEALAHFLQQRGW